MALSSRFPLKLPSVLMSRVTTSLGFLRTILILALKVLYPSQIEMVDHLDCISRYLGSTCIGLKTPTQKSLPSLFLRKAMKAHWMLKSCCHQLPSVACLPGTKYMTSLSAHGNQELEYLTHSWKRKLRPELRAVVGSFLSLKSQNVAELDVKFSVHHFVLLAYEWAASLIWPSSVGLRCIHRAQACSCSLWWQKHSLQVLHRQAAQEVTTFISWQQPQIKISHLPLVLR